MLDSCSLAAARKVEYLIRPGTAISPSNMFGDRASGFEGGMVVEVVEDREDPSSKDHGMYWTLIMLMVG
jgi:hypothetical protein